MRPCNSPKFDFTDLIPPGFLEPWSCKKIICIRTKTRITKGKIKCKLKNRNKVNLQTLTLPQINSTKSLPK